MIKVKGVPGDMLSVALLFFTITAPMDDITNLRSVP